MVRTQGRNVVSGTAVETWRDSAPRLGFQGFLVLLFHPRQNCLPSDSTTHTELGSPTAIIPKENAFQTCLQATLMEAFSYLWIPLLR